MAALLWNNADAAAAKLQELSPKFTLQEDRDIVQTMLADLAANKRLQYSDMALTDSGEAGVLQARSHITSSTFQAASKVRTDANKLIDDINRLAEEDGKQAEASASAALATVVICCLLVIVLGSVLAAFISRRITAAVHRLVARARRIAEGDLSGTDEETKLTDEIGELAPLPPWCPTCRRWRQSQKPLPAATWPMRSNRGRRAIRSAMPSPV